MVKRTPTRLITPTQLIAVVERHVQDALLRFWAVGFKRESTESEHDCQAPEEPRETRCSHTLRHREHGVRLRLDCAWGTGEDGTSYYNIWPILWVRTKAGGYALSSTPPIPSAETYQINLIGYQWHLDAFDKFCELVLDLRGVALAEIVRKPKSRHEYPTYGFQPAPTIYKLFARQSTLGVILTHNALLATVHVQQMGLICSREDGRLVFRPNTSGGPEDHLWFFISCRTSDSATAYIVSDGESWHPIVYTSVWGVPVGIPQISNILIAHKIEHASHRDAPVDLKLMTVNDQSLIQATINYYLTGTIV